MRVSSGRGITDEPLQRVLIVEDERHSRAAIGVLCRRLGFETHAAATLREGLALLDLDPDFVVLDLVLPDGSGLELLRRVRADDRRVRVAIVTAVSDGPVLDAVRALRPDRLLLKPVDFPQLRDWMTSDVARQAGGTPWRGRSGDVTPAIGP